MVRSMDQWIFLGGKVWWEFNVCLWCNNSSVSTLIVDNKWKSHLDHIPTERHNIVHSIKIHNQREHDLWFWIPSKDGQFSLNLAWNHIRNKHTEFKWSNIIWDNNCALKMSVCSLLAILSRLNTKERISKWNNNIDRSCVLCSNLNEDRDYLFFSYSNSRLLLEETMHKIRINFENSFDINSIQGIMCQN